MLDLQKREGAGLFLAKGSLCLYKPTVMWQKQVQVHWLCCLHEAVVLCRCEWNETTLYILVGRILWLLSIQRDFFNRCPWENSYIETAALCLYGNIDVKKIDCWFVMYKDKRKTNHVCPLWVNLHVPSACYYSHVMFIIWKSANSETLKYLFKNESKIV